jgi:hypothetical protein
MHPQQHRRNNLRESENNIQQDRRHTLRESEKVQQDSRHTLRKSEINPLEPGNFFSLEFFTQTCRAGVF